MLGHTFSSRSYTLLKGKSNKKRALPGEPLPADRFPGLKESVDAILRELNQGYLTVPKAVPKSTDPNNWVHGAATDRQL